VKFAWSRPAALRLAHEIGVLTALAREPPVPFLPEVEASSTDPPDRAGQQLACFLAALHHPSYGVRYGGGWIRGTGGLRQPSTTGGYASVEQEASCENLSGRPPQLMATSADPGSCRVGRECAYVTGLRRMPVDIAERSVCSPG